MKTNKSTTKFSLISGIYLFLLVFVLSTQSRSGQTQETIQILFTYLFYLPIWTVIVVIFFLDKKFIDKKWAKIVFGQKAIFWTLLFFLIIGLIFNLDYHRQVGCFVMDEQHFSTTTLLFTFASMLLLTFSYLFSREKIGLRILVFEFIFWTLRTLYFNGSLDLILVGYFTMLCWSLRLFLISKIITTRQTIPIAINKNEPPTRVLQKKGLT